MGHDYVRMVLRRGVNGQPGIPIDDPDDPDRKRSTLLPRFVLTILADYADDRKDIAEAWPSIATLARETDMTERSIQRALRVLERSGLITIVGNRKGGAKSRKYLLNFEEIFEKLDAEGVTPMSLRGDTDVARGDTDVATSDTDVARGDTDDTRTPNNPHQHPENASEQGGGGGRDESPPPRSVRSSGRAPSLSTKTKKKQLDNFLEILEATITADSKKKLAFDATSKPLRDLVDKRLASGWSLEGLSERVNLKTWNGVTNPTGILVSRLKEVPTNPDDTERERATKRQEEIEYKLEMERYNEEAAPILARFADDPRFGRANFRAVSQGLQTGSDFFLNQLANDYIEIRLGNTRDTYLGFWIDQTNEIVQSEVKELKTKVAQNGDAEVVGNFLVAHQLDQILTKVEVEERSNLPTLVRQIEQITTLRRSNCATNFFLVGCTCPKGDTP